MEEVFKSRFENLSDKQKKWDDKLLEVLHNDTSGRFYKVNIYYHYTYKKKKLSIKTIKNKFSCYDRVIKFLMKNNYIANGYTMGELNFILTDKSDALIEKMSLLKGRNGGTIASSTLRPLLGAITDIMKMWYANLVRRQANAIMFDDIHKIDEMDKVIDSINIVLSNYKVCYRKYQTKKNDLSEEIKSEKYGVKKNKRLQQKWETLKELDIKVNITKEKFAELSLEDQKRYLMLQCWLLIPPRRNMDWELMKVIYDGENYANMNSEFNWLNIANDGKMKFYFHRYKTSKKYGMVEIDLDNEEYSQVFRDCLTIYLKNREGYYKSEFVSGQPVSTKYLFSGIQKDFGNALTAIETKSFGVLKKNVARCNDFRKFFITKLLGQENCSLEKQIRCANLMSHTLDIQNGYFKPSDGLFDDLPKNTKVENFENGKCPTNIIEEKNVSSGVSYDEWLKLSEKEQEKVIKKKKAEQK